MNADVIDYKIVMREHWFQLVESVQKEISFGWQPLGAPFVVPAGTGPKLNDGALEFGQAVVLLRK